MWNKFEIRSGYPHELNEIFDKETSVRVSLIPLWILSMRHHHPARIKYLGVIYLCTVTSIETFLRNSPCLTKPVEQNRSYAFFVLFSNLVLQLSVTMMSGVWVSSRLSWLDCLLTDSGFFCLIYRKQPNHSQNLFYSHSLNFHVSGSTL